MTTGLPASRLVNISVNVSPSGATAINFNSCCIIGSSSVITVAERIRSYGTIAEVADDFGTSAPEYLAALLFFSQKPQPVQLYIGRWAEAATHGLLYCGALNATEQTLATWTAIADGGFKINVDGGGLTAVTNCDFSAQVNLNGVAGVITTRLAAAGLAATCTWNGSQFVFQSTATGAASTLSALAAAAGGDTDISVMLKGTAATLSADVAGIAAETPVACFTILDELSTSFYAATFASLTITDNQLLAVAAYVEAAENPHVFGSTTAEGAAIVSPDTTSIGAMLKAAGYNRSFAQYSAATHYAVASIIGYMSTVNYDGQNTTVTAMFKNEPGVTAEDLTSSQANALDENNYNYFVAFNNQTNILVNGKMASSIYIDDAYNDDWLANDMQTRVFNLLITSRKIPLTDGGMHQIATALSASCAQGVTNGMIAPGVWPFAGFGQLQEDEYLNTGYYVFTPPVSTLTQAQRAAREAVAFQVAINSAGATHSVGVTVNVNL